nr:hypothetical protein CFP56_55256 [Quercus suber]
MGVYLMPRYIQNAKCSFAWSILQARDVINKGAVWRVGDACFIDIWDQANSTIISPRNNSTVSHVKDLFYPGIRIWDSGLLERMFVPWEAELIKIIPVSEGCVEDLLIWPLTPDGNYSVRSAYCTLAEEASS